MSAKPRAKKPDERIPLPLEIEERVGAWAHAMAEIAPRTGMAEGEVAERNRRRWTLGREIAEELDRHGAGTSSTALLRGIAQRLASTHSTLADLVHVAGAFGEDEIAEPQHWSVFVLLAREIEEPTLRAGYLKTLPALCSVQAAKKRLPAKRQDPAKPSDQRLLDLEERYQDALGMFRILTPEQRIGFIVDAIDSLSADVLSQILILLAEQVGMIAKAADRLKGRLSEVTPRTAADGR